MSSNGNGVLCYICNHPLAFMIIRMADYTRNTFENVNERILFVETSTASLKV